MLVLGFSEGTDQSGKVDGEEEECMRVVVVCVGSLNPYDALRAASACVVGAMFQIPSLGLERKKWQEWAGHSRLH